jgi:hypothetical protein
MNVRDEHHEAGIVSIQPKDPEDLSPDEMRQGVKSGRVRNILAVSTALAVVALTIVYFFFYL